MIIPQRNATLLSISGGGFTRSYRGTSGADPVKWSGKRGAFVSEKVERVTEGQTINRVKRTYIIIPGDLRPAVVIKQGDTFTFEYEGDQHQREVHAFETHAMPGVPRTVRVYFTHA